MPQQVERAFEALELVARVNMESTLIHQVGQTYHSIAGPKLHWKGRASHYSALSVYLLGQRHFDSVPKMENANSKR